MRLTDLLLDLDFSGICSLTNSNVHKSPGAPLCQQLLLHLHMWNSAAGAGGGVGGKRKACSQLDSYGMFSSPAPSEVDPLGLFIQRRILELRSQENIQWRGSRGKPSADSCVPSLLDWHFWVSLTGVKTIPQGPSGAGRTHSQKCGPFCANLVFSFP